ncbi:beta-lactamase family protein [Niastella caeni]|uniref:Beta-lactamase family protein n=1 Tax=Niastella caeni TaxID=2569763 RepID=A0A4S8HXG1_9BACT|nr:serine hydrolase [Niastella caeni]THU40367.1 beta-lactamase family protein [Niastella caeni]
MNFAAMPVSVSEKDYAVPGNNPLADTLDQRIEQLVRPYIQKGNTAGLVLAVIDHGKIRRYSYGTTDKNKNELPDLNKTIFEIGSVTKTFTSLFPAVLVGSGHLWGLTSNVN